MDYPEVVWKPVVQKYRYPYANVYDVIRDKSQAYSSNCMKQKNRKLRKTKYLFNTFLITKAQGMLWSPA